MTKIISVGKTVSINQPAYLPWLGYFERIAKSDHHIVLDHVQFEKNSMINRNKILTRNGALMLTLPVCSAGKFGDLAINKVSLHTSKKCLMKHWKSIYYSYKKAPFFTKYQEELYELYLLPWHNLNDLLKAQLRFFLKALGINTSISFSSEEDFQTQKSDLVLEICQYYQTVNYLSGSFGKNYLDNKSFYAANINMEFQDYQHPEYQQLESGFTSHLSVLDLLFNHGDDSLKILRN
ncbi:WbqC family protein [Paraglaciecola sp.]|nr:WbqC family protein [Paraglaciecola sp.]